MSLARTEPVLIRHLAHANDDAPFTALRAFTRARSEVSCHGLGHI